MRHSVMLMVSCVLTFLVLNNVKVAVEAGMTKLFCPSSNYYGGTCGKNWNTLCVNDVKGMITKRLGKPLPKNYGVRCDKCVDEPPRKGYLRMRQCFCRYDC
ncbi:hypothetical protein N665_0151s0027 [Sinapis alba]|nr:hypothetical protein N665_1489s0004 [Sinapis alba]KAF8105934.1 hypothetical protein N665_0151s0027 [Sinapis alba]